MTPLRDSDLKKRLKNLDGQLRMKPVHHEQLRNRILIESEAAGESKRKPKPRRLAIGLAAAVVFLLLVGTSTLYSPAMASLVERILPLEINSSESPVIDPLHSEIQQIALDNGFSVASVGTTPDPFTIHLSFVEGAVSLSEMQQAVEPAIRQLLYDQGIDQYQLDFTAVEETEYEPSDTSLLMDNIETALNEAYLKYGYSDLAKHSTYGIQGGLFSNTLEVDMPDHVEEAQKIKQFLVDTIEKEKWDIQKVELRYYNAAHRAQDDRWAMISSEIYDALAGKSAYSIIGLSYKVKDGVTLVKIKTALPEQTDPQVLAKVDAAIRAYLETNEINSTIQQDTYRIQLLSEDKTLLLEVTNASK